MLRILWLAEGWQMILGCGLSLDPLAGATTELSQNWFQDQTKLFESNNTPWRMQYNSRAGLKRIPGGEGRRIGQKASNGEVGHFDLSVTRPTQQHAFRFFPNLPHVYSYLHTI